jgi:hypothetical protein
MFHVPYTSPVTGMISQGSGMNLLDKLGFKISKPKAVIRIPAKISEKNKAIIERRKALYRKDSLETAEMYASWITDQALFDISTIHNYRCVMWGSRKFARLLNLSRNILDVEILTESSDLEEADRTSILKLLMWLSLITPIPIKRYHLSNNAEAESKILLKDMLMVKNKLFKDAEFNLIMEGVFEGTNTVKGNSVLDIFHDALRFEEAQFGSPCPKEWMRTELGKNEVFRVKAHRDSTANSSPDWLVEFQRIKKIDTFVDASKARENTMSSEDDGISM